MPKNCICTKMVGAYTLRDAQKCLILRFDDEIKGKPKLGFNMYFNLKNNE